MTGPMAGVSQWVTDPAAAAAEDQGFVGQRPDAGAGLIYLNARSMDPNAAASSSPTGATPTSQAWGRTGTPTASTIR
ncbi:MAG: hypothetical protein JKP98_25620 [Rhodobacteraceae bacterium]|nr:hypothetical protein [Paracoccaceae bacterium]